MNPSGILHNIELNKKPKPKGHEFTLEGMQPDHVIYSVVTFTKLPLCCVNLKKKNNNNNKKKEK